jgi:hypothetical protein
LDGQFADEQRQFAIIGVLTTRDEAHTGQIGALGICASGGYALTAAATDHRIKAVATVSADDIARQFRYGADWAQDPAVFQGMLDSAAAARTAEARGEGVGTFPLFPNTAEEARARGQHAYEGFESYCTGPNQHPRSAKFLTWTSIDHMAFFDAFRFVGLIRRPVLMNVGSEAVTSWMSLEAFQHVQGPKELHWIEGASHNALYYKEQYVAPLITKLTESTGRTSPSLLLRSVTSH